jgi:sulfide:quinone oxidoreductase
MSGARRAAKVLIAGGGVAGLEAAMALADQAGDRAEITLVAPEDEFLYKPLTVEEPFTGHPTQRHELRPVLAEIGVRFVHAAVRGVDPDRHVVELGSGDELDYGFLIVCVGGRARPAYQGVETFWSNRSDLDVDGLIERAARSFRRTFALVVPPATSWSLPLYELALLIRRRSEQLGANLNLRLFTPESAPVIVFGRVASDAVATLLTQRGIVVEAGRRVVEDETGALHLAPGGNALAADVVLSLPIIAGPKIKGLPSDPSGFMPIDEHCRVEGVEDVYAAGDGTNFPVKQGGLATQQADAACEHLASRLGAALEPAAFKPVLRGRLITGADPLHMKHGLTGGQGEGTTSLDYLWWPPHKISGRYLSAWLGHTTVFKPLEPPFRPLDVEVSWPQDWHAEPAASDAKPPLVR